MANEKAFENKVFQSTLSHGERHLHKIILFRGAIFQSTLSHGERHGNATDVNLDYVISIHALTRRATFETKHLLISSLNFNPRSHTESDRKSFRVGG